MTMEINSFSSGLMQKITVCRNQPGISNKIIGQAAYALIVGVSAIETVVTLAFSALSLAALAFSRKPFECSTQRLSSSAFCLGWSVADFFLNPFFNVLVADEKSARKMLKSRNLIKIPSGAII